MSETKVPVEQEEEKKKKKFLIPIIIIAAVLLLGGTAALLAYLGVFKAPEGGESDPEIVDDTQLWWNVDRGQYAGQSDIGTSSRPTDKDDGYYHVLFATEGRQVTRRVAEKKVLNVIDSNDLMGLVFDEKGIIVGMKKIEDFTGGYEVAGMYINEVGENRSLLMNSAATLNGMDIDFTIPEDAIIYDVSGAKNYVGMEIKFEDLQQYDRIYAVKNLEGEVYRVFVTSRYVKPEIYWNVERQWDSELLSTKRTPNAEGIYEILLACNGEQIIVKTKDRNIATKIDQAAAKCFGLEVDEEGFIKKFIAASSATGGGTFGSWYHILAMDGENVHAKKISKASDTGKEVDGKLAKDYHAYDVSGEGEFVGVEIFDLKVSDQIHALTNANGEIVVVFVVGRLKDSPMYWNLERQYDSTNKVTKRTPEADGLYHFKLAVKGQVKEFVTADKEIASKVDSYAARCFGLKVNGNVIKKTYSQASVSGAGAIASWYDITSFDGKNFHAKKIISATDTGKEVDGILAPNAEIYNVSTNYDNFAGEKTNLRVGDRVHGCLDLNGETAVLYIVNRPVDSEIYWNINRSYNSTKKESTRKPDENGYYVFKMAVNGKQVTLRTKDKKIADSVDSYAAKCMGLKLNGDIIMKTYSTSTVPSAAGGTCASWYDVLSVNGRNFHAEKLISATDTGSKGDFTLAADAKVINVGGLYTVCGEYTTLKVGDRVHCLKNKNGEVSYAFIVNRVAPDKTGVCPICDATVTWAAANGQMNAQTDASGAPLAITHVYTPANMSLTSQGTTPYRTEKNASGSTSYYKTSDVHFDLCGYTLTAAAANRALAFFGDGANSIIFDSSSAKTGKIVSGDGRDNDKGAAIWMMGTGNVTIKDCTIDMTGLDTPGSTGGIYGRYTLENVKILGGKAKAGSVLYATGATTLNNVTITGGVNEEGGSVYVKSGTTLTLKGNVAVSGGKLADGTAANIYLESGAKLDASGLTSADGTIYVTTADAGAFTTANFAGLASKFKADIPGATITEKDGVLYMNYVVDGVKFTTSTASVEVGATGRLEAVTTPGNLASLKRTYTSSDPSKVTIDENGQIIGIAPTTTPVKVTVKVTDSLGNEFEGTCDVTVTPASKPLTHYHAETTFDKIGSDSSKISYTAWTDGTKIPNASGYYYLDTDVTLTVQQSMSANVDLHLCLNGHTIKAQDGTNVSRLISLHNTGCALTICDCSGDKGQIVGPGANGGEGNQGRAIWVRYGALTIYGGTIVGGYSTYTSGGGAISVSGGTTFNFYGGTIKNGVASTHGGNVTVTSSGTFNMYGGTIEGGNGSATMDASGALTTVSGWHTSGNLYGTSGSIINIYGGTITGGTANYGGNMYTGGKLTIDGQDGAVIISDGKCVSSGANVWADAAAVVNITNAEITNGVSQGSSANVYLKGKESHLTNTIISGGSAKTFGSVTLDTGVITLDNVTVDAVTADTAAYWYPCGVVLRDSGLDLPAVTITDSKLQSLRVEYLGSLELSGKNEIGTSTSNGFYLKSAGLGDKVTLADDFDSASKIYVRSEVEGTVVKNGATNITSFVKNNNDEWTMEADGDAIVMKKNAPAQKHLHCVCGGVLDADTKTLASHTCDATLEWKEWTATDSLPVATGNYYLTSNVTIAKTVVLQADTDVKICLNGHTVTGSNLARVITDYANSKHAANAKLTLTDCQTTPGTFTNTRTANENDGGLIWMCGSNQELNIYNVTLDASKMVNAKSSTTIGTGGTLKFNLYSGTIIGGKVTTAKTSTYVYGGAFYVSGSCVFNMYGGTVKNGSVENSASWTCGGNIYVGSSATMNMYGGTVEGGKAIKTAGSAVGGNIGLSGTAKFNMYGGTIKNGEASEGGNIWADNGGIINILGGTVEGGVATGNAGNIFTKGTTDKIGAINITDATIKNGTAGKGSTSWNGGGNIYAGANVNVTIKNSTIEGGTSPAGGNVCFGSNSANTGKLVVENSTITGGNAVNGQGGNFFIDTYATTTLTGVTVKDGTSTGSGANILVKTVNGVTIDGTTEISGGKRSTGEANNLHVTEAANAVTFGSNFAIKSGSPIGVSMSTAGVFTANAVDKANFVSDSDDYNVIVAADNKLSLSAKLLESVSLNNETLTLQAGREQDTLTAVLSPADAAFTSVTWESSTPAVATVTKDATDARKATVTMVAEGTTTITVTVTADGVATPLTATCEVTVKPGHKHALATNADILADKGTKIEWVDLNAALEDLMSKDTTLKTTLDAYKKLPAGNYYLSDNLTLSGQAALQAGQDLSICLNGYKLAATSRCLDTFTTGTHIAVCDCSDGEKGVVTGKTGDQGGNWVRYGSIDFYGGTITGSSAKNGAGMFVEGGMGFNMYGGTLLANTATANGGNLNAAYGTASGAAKIQLLGGAIKNGSALLGGNIYAGKNVTLSIDNVEISGGKATSGTDHDIYLSEGALLNVGTLKDDAKIAILMEVPGVFTANAVDEAVAEKFIAANDGAGIIWNKDGKLEMIPGVTAIAFEETEMTIASAGDTKLQFTTAPEAGNINEVTWTSSNEDVATVAGDTEDDTIGIVTPVGEGEAVITATVNGTVTATVKVTVPEHTHCYCGGTIEDGFLFYENEEDPTLNLAHECELGEFIAWDSATMLPRYDDLKDGDNNFYLTNDITISETWFPALSVSQNKKIEDMDGKTITICLNGHSITSKSSRLLSSLVAAPTGVHTANLSVAFTDCADARGTIYTKDGDCGTNQGTFAWLCGENDALGLFNVTIDSTKTKGSSAGMTISLEAKNPMCLIMGATIKGGTAGGKGGVIAVRDDALCEMVSGEIIGGKSTTYGASVYVNKGEFDMIGGTISGGIIDYGTSTWKIGGNVYIDEEGVFNMLGGEIKDGEATHGGNIGIETGIFNLLGGTISGGRSTLASKGANNSIAHVGGGNVYVNKGTFNMIDGEIKDGFAMRTGGNVAIGVNGSGTTSSPFVYGTFNMLGGTISGGTVNSSKNGLSFGGNVYTRGLFTMIGGTIKGGQAKENVQASKNDVNTGITAQGYGGNVTVNGGIFTMAGGEILDGTAAVGGGNIFARAFGTNQPVVQLVGGTISGGSSWAGGGIRIQSDTNYSAEIIIGGEVQIIGNKCNSNTGYASGIFINDNRTKVTLTGKAVIKDNKNSSNGVASDFQLNGGIINVTEYEGTDPIIVRLGAKADNAADHVTGDFATVDKEYNIFQASDSTLNVKYSGGKYSMVTK